MALTPGSFCLFHMVYGVSDSPWSVAQTTAAVLLWKLPGRLPFVPEPPLVSKSIMQGELSVLSLKSLSHSPSLKMLLQRYQMLTEAAYLLAPLYRQKGIHVKYTCC